LQIKNFREKSIVSEPLAHSGGHLLADHLQSVANIAADYSQAFDAATGTQRWAYLSGFQRFLRQSDNASWSCDVQ